jgi:hypothetical protein
MDCKTFEELYTQQALKQAGVNADTYVSTSGIEFTLSCKGTWRVKEWVGSGRFGNRSITAGGGRGLHLKTMSDLNNIYNLTITIPKTKN